VGSVIQLNIREVLILIGAYGGLVVLFGRVLVSQFDKRMSERFAAMEKQRKDDKELNRDHQLAMEQRMVKTDNHVAEVQRTLDGLRTELPLQYVRREDWIRFGATIDSKLDRLTDAVHQRNQRGMP
jgi:hypothetical protein